MKKLPQFRYCKEVARTGLFRVQEIELQFSNGEVRTYERLASGQTPAVIIIPMIDKNTVLLIREYGVGLESYELGLPKGKVDKGETLENAANRELKEEVGHGANAIKLIKNLSQSPGYMMHKTCLVLAQDLYPEVLEGDEPEPLDVVPMPLDQLDEWVARGDLSESRTIAGLYMARAIMQDNVDFGDYQ